MVLHTIIDINDVMNPADFTNKCEEKYKMVENCIIKGVQCNEGFRVSGLFSTNPDDYLNPGYQRGSILK